MRCQCYQLLYFKKRRKHLFEYHWMISCLLLLIQIKRLQSRSKPVKRMKSVCVVLWLPVISEWQLCLLIPNLSIFLSVETIIFSVFYFQELGWGRGGEREVKPNFVGLAAEPGSSSFGANLNSWLTLQKLALKHWLCKWIVLICSKQSFLCGNKDVVSCALFLCSFYRKVVHNTALISLDSGLNHVEARSAVFLLLQMSHLILQISAMSLCFITVYYFRGT